MFTSCATTGSDDDDRPDAALPPDAPSAPPDAMPPAPDAMPTPDAMPQAMAVSVRHDVTGDFAGNGALESGAAATRFETVAPIGYHQGGLLASASDIGVFTDAINTPWSVIQAMPVTGSSAVARSVDIDWLAGTPVGVGITNGDNWTQWLEGEIYLDAGTWTFHLLVDDHGFLEIQTPGAPDYTRVVSANWPTETTSTFVVATSGWYPVRLAFCEEAGNALVRLRYGLNGGPAAAIPAERLRFRTDNQAGWYMAGWDDIYGVGTHNVRIDQTAPANQDWGAGTPADLGMTNADNFAVRWAGQYHINVSGSYSFRLNTDDGQRLWIDGMRYINSWDSSTHNGITPAILMTPGWHDFVVDVTEAGGNARAALTIEAGPDGAGAPLALSRTRPAVGRDLRYETGVNRTDYAIPDQGQAESPITLVAPSGAAVTGVDVSWTFNHSFWGDLEVRVIAPNGQAALLRNRVGGSTSGTATDRVFTEALNGVPVNGTWQLRFNDRAGADIGTILDFQLTVHYQGGAAPLQLNSAFDSPFIDLGPDAISLDILSYAENAPPGTGIALFVRTADTDVDIASQPWSGPYTDPAGSVLDLPAARFAQYRIEFTSDGVAEPSVDWVQLDYSTY